MVNTLNKNFYRIMRRVENELYLRAMLYDIHEETELSFDADEVADILSAYSFDPSYLSLDEVKAGRETFWCLTFYVDRDDAESPWMPAGDGQYYAEAYVYNIDAPELSEFGEVAVQDDGVYLRRVV